MIGKKLMNVLIHSRIKVLILMVFQEYRVLNADSKTIDYCHVRYK